MVVCYKTHCGSLKISNIIPITLTNEKPQSALKRQNGPTSCNRTKKNAISMIKLFF